MSWIAKLDKDDFVGKWSLEHVRDRGLENMLVGFEMENGHVPVEGAQVVLEGTRPIGRITSSRWSPELRRSIGMAWVPAELAEEGKSFLVTVKDGFERATVRLRPFFDPDGERLRS